MRLVPVLAVAAVLTAVAAYVFWPKTLSPEDQVRAAVREMQAGADARDPSRVVAQVSERFRSPGLGDRADLKRLLLGELLRGGGLRVVVLQADVQPEAEGRIRWVGRVAVARAGGGGLAAVTEAEVRQLHIDALFADEGGQWRAVEATVRQVQ